MSNKQTVFIGVVFGIMLSLLIFIGKAPFLQALILAIFLTAGIVLYAANIKDAASGKKSQKRTNKPTPRATTPKPIYIHRPFENGFVYRIEWHHGRQYVFEGFSNKYIYRIDGDKVYRGTETKVYYQIKGNKVYRAFEYKDPVYRIEDGKIYQGNFGRRPVFTISNKAVR